VPNDATETVAAVPGDEAAGAVGADEARADEAGADEAGADEAGADAAAPWLASAAHEQTAQAASPAATAASVTCRGRGVTR
jgi:hypothetical protein